MSAPLSKTAVVLVDPYNDFLHPDGKLTPRLTDIDKRGTVKHIQELIAAARAHNIPIYYGLHQEWTETAFSGWQHMTLNNTKQQNWQFFEKGTFGAEIFAGMEPDEKNGDVVVSKHWNSE
jgi:nicotinamidase-related amidase